MKRLAEWCQTTAAELDGSLRENAKVAKAGDGAELRLCAASDYLKKASENFTAASNYVDSANELCVPAVGARIREGLQKSPPPEPGVLARLLGASDAQLIKWAEGKGRA